MAQTQIHQTLNSVSRNVVIYHPNSFDAVCFKRFFTTQSGENEIGGIAILGGEDTPDIRYQELGMAKVLFVENWQSSKVIADNFNANDSRVKTAALIEPDIEGDFELGKQDIFYLYIDDETALAYEIVGIELPVGLPSAMNAKRYLLNKRDDLDYQQGLLS
ncbi:hypothetical protein ACWIUH_01395 [Ursidibacter arcticus]